MEYENPQQFDKDKGYLNLPYFTVWRKSTKHQKKIIWAPHHSIDEEGEWIVI